MPPRWTPALFSVLLLANVGFAQPPSEGLPPPRRLDESQLPPPPPPLPSPMVGVPDHGPDASCALPIEKSIPYCPMLLVPHETATTMPDWKLRTVEVARIPAGPVLDFHEEKQIVTELELRPRQVEEQVVCTESKPVTVTDPITGCCRTEYQPCSVVKIVKVTVYETVPVQRWVKVRVPYLKYCGELSVKNLVLDQLTVPAIEKTYSVVSSPNEINVLVPAPTCAGPVGPHPLHP